MSSIYPLDSQKNLFLYTTDSLICLRNASGETLDRAIILCNDYADHLTDVIFGKTLYFTYQNNKQDIILRSITDLNILYKLSSQDTPDCSNPYLTILNNHLILFYLVKNPLDDSYCIKSICPFDTDILLSIPYSFSARPRLHFSVMSGGLLLAAETAETKQILYIQNSGVIQPLTSFDEELQSRMDAQAAEHTAKLSAMEKEYSAHLAKVEAAFSAQVSNLKTELFQKNKMIESAKLQYNQLMDTASKYRDEAIKWRSKFYKED